MQVIKSRARNYIRFIHNGKTYIINDYYKYSLMGLSGPARIQRVNLVNGKELFNLDVPDELNNLDWKQTWDTLKEVASNGQVS